MLIGDRFYMYNIFINLIISNIENFFFFGFKYCRFVGIYVLLIRKYNMLNKSLIKLSFGKLKMILNLSKVYIGFNLNKEYKLIIIGKVGRNRLFGIKFNVRGVVMNLVDYLYGGGEGKKFKKSFLWLFWGKMFKWIKIGRKIKYLN